MYLNAFDPKNEEADRLPDGMMKPAGRPPAAGATPGDPPQTIGGAG